jgi:hypothetical protein
MGFNLWYGDGPSDAVSLGDPFTLMRSFGEMAEALNSLEGGQEGGPFAELFSVPLYGEQDVDAPWFAEVNKQAKGFLKLHGRKLSPHARWILSQIAAAPGGRNAPNRHAKRNAFSASGSGSRPQPPRRRRQNDAGRTSGIAATGLTNAEVGELMDYQFQEAGYRPILPPSWHRTPLDREWDNSGLLFDVTACSTHASEYKTKIKKSETKDKIAYAELNEAKPNSMITVVDFEKKKIHIYWRDGIGSFTLKSTEWHYAGTITFGTKELKRFRKR